MPNTLTTIFTSTPSSLVVEAQHPNTLAWIPGTQLANGTWQVIHTGVTKTALGAVNPTVTGRLQSSINTTASVQATGPVLNNVPAAPTGTSALGNATGINVTASTSPNGLANRILASGASTGPFAQIYQGMTSSYQHAVAAGVTQYYQYQYVGSGFYDDSPVTSFSGTAAVASLTTYPRLNVGSMVSGDSMTTDLQGVTNWVKQYGTSFNVPITTFANTTDYTVTNAGNTFVAANVNNLASSGSGSRKQAGLLLAVAPHPAVAPWAGMVGLNNLRLAQAASPLKRYETINAAHRAMLAVQFAKTVVLPFGGNGGSGYTTNFTASRAASLTAPFTTVALLQDWGSRTVYFRGTAADAGANGFYQPSIAAGETVTFSITGDALAIGTWGCDGSALTLSRFEVRVDGVLKTTYNPVGRCEVSSIPSNNDGHTQDGLINDAIFLLGLGNTAHTVVLTFLDAGVAGVWDYAAILKTPAEANGAAAFVLDVPLLSTTAGIGYTYPGFPTWRPYLIDAVTSRTTNLKSVLPGYPIAFVDIGNRYQPETVPGDVQQIDGIHPTTQGHGKIELRANDYMSGSITGAATPPSYPNYLANSQLVTFPIATNQRNVAGIISTAATVAGYGNTGLSSYRMPINAASSILVRQAAGAFDAIFGVSTTQAQTPYTSMLFAFYRASNTGKYNTISAGAVTATTTTPTNLDFTRISRAVDGTLTLQASSDGGSTFGPVLATSASNPANPLYLVSDLEKAGLLDYPQGFGLEYFAFSSSVAPTLAPGATLLSVLGNAAVVTDSSGRSSFPSANQALGSYGNLARSGYKLVGAGWFGHEAIRTDALDVLIGTSTTDTLTTLYNMGAGTWNSSGSAVYPGRRISSQDLTGTPVRAGTATFSTLGDLCIIRRTVNPAGDSFDRFTLEQSSDGGNSFNLLYTYTYKVATGTPIYIVFDFSGPGIMYSPQGVGVALV